MVGETIESCLPEIAKIAFKLSTMVGEIFESYLPEIAKISFKLSTMVLENIFKIACLKYLNRIKFRRD